jgi:peptidoglycan/LPS O-acetylase OafA/YrhL
VSTTNTHTNTTDSDSGAGAGAGPTSSTEIGTAGRRHPLRRATLASGVVAAAGTTAVATVALAADVPLEIDGEQIPLLAFVELTLIGAALGGLIAWASGRFVARPRRWFAVAAIVLTVLSCIPSVAYPPDLATKAVLVAAHLLAASIVVPALARQVRPGSDRAPAR